MHVRFGQIMIALQHTFVDDLVADPRGKRRMLRDRTIAFVGDNGVIAAFQHDKSRRIDGERDQQQRT